MLQLRRATEVLWLVAILTSPTGVWGDPETVNGLLDKKDSPPQFEGQQPYKPQVGQQPLLAMPEIQKIGLARTFQMPVNFPNGEFPFF